MTRGQHRRELFILAELADYVGLTEPEYRRCRRAVLEGRGLPVTKTEGAFAVHVPPPAPRAAYGRLPEAVRACLRRHGPLTLRAIVLRVDGAPRSTQEAVFRMARTGELRRVSGRKHDPRNPTVYALPESA